MKKTLKLIAYSVIFSLMALGCQKEAFKTNEIIPTCTTNMYYVVDGFSGTTNLPNDEAWDDFINRMFALAKEGYSVSFRIGNSAERTMASKEVVTYITDNEDDAKTWAIQMTKQGYEVDITYDAETGLWTCIAVK